MLYFSLDIETTGVDFENNQIIEFGAIFEDTNKQLPFDKIPKFKRIIKHESYNGSAIAINMNTRIFQILAEYEKIKNFKKDEFAEINNIIKPNQLMNQFYTFVLECYSGYKLPIPYAGINIAGKNFTGFDNRFIEKLRDNYGMDFSLKFNNRVADPAALYVDWLNDDSLPSLGDCKVKAGIYGAVTHDAIEDAWDVIQLLRKKY